MSNNCDARVSVYALARELGVPVARIIQAIVRRMPRNRERNYGCSEKAAREFLSEARWNRALACRS